MEEVLLLDSVDDFDELSLVDLAAESDFESEAEPESLEELESEDLVSDEDELSLGPFLFSDGGLGRA